MIGFDRSTDGRVVTLTLQRPEKRNALNQAMVTELTHVLRDLDGDKSVRAIVLTGAGDVFSAGADLQALDEMRTAGFEHNLADSKALADLFHTMRTTGHVIIARVNGHAIAGGSGLVAAADLSVAAEDAKLGFTEVRIGFVPALVSVLVRGRIGEQDIRELFLTGALISARRAAEIGLLNRCVAAANIDEAVDEWTRTVCRSTSREAIRATKNLLAGADLLDRLYEAAHVNARARESADCKAGIAAFLERRDAPWVRAYDDDHDEPA